MNELKRLKQLEEENRRVKNLVADQALDIQMLKDVTSKTGKACGQTGNWIVSQFEYSN